TGVVPEAELATRLTRDARGLDSARASALAAALLAERGEADAAARWCARASDADRRGTASALARSWCAVHTGAADEVRDDGSLLGAVADALARGLRGEAAVALRRIAQRPSVPSEAPDDILRGLELSPVARAYRAVAATLVRFWSGDVRGAVEELSR